MITIVVCVVVLSRLEAERIDDSHWYHDRKEWHPVTIALIAGIAGAQSVTFAKGVVELIKSEIEGAANFEKHYLAAPFCLLALICFTITQLHYLNVGLASFDTLFIFPLYQAVWILFTALGGIITYKEYRVFGALNYVLFPAGVIVTLVGLWIISGRKASYSLLQDDDSYGVPPYEGTNEHHKSATGLGLGSPYRGEQAWKTTANPAELDAGDCSDGAGIGETGSFGEGGEEVETNRLSNDSRY